MKTTSAFDEASDVLVGGVNSPVRAYGSVGGSPVFVSSGKGQQSRALMDSPTLIMYCRMGHYWLVMHQIV